MIITAYFRSKTLSPHGFGLSAFTGPLTNTKPFTNQVQTQRYASVTSRAFHIYPLRWRCSQLRQQATKAKVSGDTPNYLSNYLYKVNWGNSVTCGSRFSNLGFSAQTNFHHYTILLPSRDYLAVVLCSDESQLSVQKNQDY